jgi:hypothetical protein
MYMAQELYALLMPTAFCPPTNPGNVAIYVRPVLAGQAVNTTPFTRAEQLTIDTQFVCKKHCFLLMRNIRHACFTALDASINATFKVSNDPTIKRWHAGMCVLDILDQFSSIYGQPTPAVLEQNNAAFRSLYLAADTPKVLF